MITSMLTWLEHRTGIRKLIGAALLEGVPGGAKWRYVWGSCLAFVFSIQLITGLLLMTAYSPSASQAWSSVHFIQYKMDFGWFIRGLHHFGSQTMMVLIGLHMLQVVIAGAHLPPREVNWWLGLGLLGVTFGLSLTGYLLPWDQKGYWATEVATKIMSNVPFIGAEVKQLMVGGPDSGNHTLTRFYGLHVALLPGGLILLLIAHIYVFRRHGVTSKANVEGLVTKPENEHGAECFWPRQAFYDMLACMLIFSVMLGLVLYGFSHPVEAAREADGPNANLYNHWAKAGQRGLGADLDAPADRQTNNYPARPEWYFLFLFQLLKYFPPDIGSFYIPNGVAAFLVILPLLGYGPLRKFGHFVGLLTMMSLLIFIVGLTAMALRDDAPDGILFGLVKNADQEAIDKAKHFQESVHEAEALAKRACQIAMPGSPVEGAHILMRNDPLTAGRKAFQENCGGCHNFSKREGDLFHESWTGGKSASDLGDFGSEQWVRGLLDNPMSNKYFGLVGEESKDDDGESIPHRTNCAAGMKGIVATISMKCGKKKNGTRTKLRSRTRSSISSPHGSPIKRSPKTSATRNGKRRAALRSMRKRIAATTVTMSKNSTPTEK